MAGSRRTATRFTPGAICLSNSSHFALMPYSNVVKPVAFLPGDEVVVREGVLAGVRGVVRERKNGRELIIWLREIGRGVAFTIGSTLVEAVSST